MDMDFKVNENVLIPRPETEELVRWVIEDIKGTGTRIQLPEVQPAVRGARVRDSHERHGLPNQRADLPDESPNKLDFHILDIGTGSGCIAVSLAKNLPGVKVHALDVSVGALNVARKNAHLNQVNISFLKADILDVPDSEVRYDIMVSNPPYVRESERKDMQKNVTDHEPESALFVSDENPLKFYDAIARFAPKKPEGTRKIISGNQPISGPGNRAAPQASWFSENRKANGYVREPSDDCRFPQNSLLVSFLYRNDYLILNVEQQTINEQCYPQHL